jgi:uncharacterized membrane protein (DUF485 family)
VTNRLYRNRDRLLSVYSYSFLLAYVLLSNFIAYKPDITCQVSSGVSRIVYDIQIVIHLTINGNRQAECVE